MFPPLLLTVDTQTEYQEYLHLHASLVVLSQICTLHVLRVRDVITTPLAVCVIYLDMKQKFVIC